MKIKGLREIAGLFILGVRHFSPFVPRFIDCASPGFNVGLKSEDTLSASHYARPYQFSQVNHGYREMVLHPRNVRIVDNCLRSILNKKNQIDPVTALKTWDFFERINRQICTSQVTSFYLNDVAQTALNTIIATFSKLLSDHPILPGDVDAACRAAITETLNNTTDAPRFIKEVEKIVCEGIKNRRHITTLTGLVLEGVDELAIGPLLLQKPKESIINESSGLASTKLSTWKNMQHGLWISRTHLGSKDYCEQLFFDAVILACGILAVAFTTRLSRGGLEITLIPSMPGRSRPTAANWFSYEVASKELCSATNMEKFHTITLDRENSEGLQQCEWFLEFVRIVNLPSVKCNEAEILVRRGLYWFYDAQTDTPLEMKMIKFWSCIECFFSTKELNTDNHKTTDKIRRGLLAVLTYGGYGFSPPEQWDCLKRKITKLYNKRSVAVHEGQFTHVVAADVIEVSKWAAFILMEMTMLINVGFDSREKIKSEVDRMHKLRDEDDHFRMSPSDRGCPQI